MEAGGKETENLKPLMINDSSNAPTPSVVWSDYPDFIENVHKWQCPLCHGILIDPVQTECGHLFCEICLTQYLSKNGEVVLCPVGINDCITVTKLKVFKDVSARREIYSLKVNCQNKRFGCTTVMKLEEAQEHFKNCIHKRFVCMFKEQGCEKVLKEKDIVNHVTSCPYKNKILSLCTFNIFGCLNKGTKEELRQHDLNYTSRHLEMVATYIREKVTIETKEKKDIIMNMIDDLEEKRIKGEQDLQAAKQELAQARYDINILKNIELLNENENATQASRYPFKETVEQIDKQVGVLNLRLVELDLRSQLLEVATYDGTLLWKISNFKKRKNDAVTGKTKSLISQPFFTSRHGFKMCGRIYLAGDGMGKGTHLSIFFTIMRGDYDALLTWPFRRKVTIMLMDQEGSCHFSDSFRPDPNSSSFQRPRTEMNVAIGCPTFVPQSKVDYPNSRYIKEDTMFIKMIVDPYLGS